MKNLTIICLAASLFIPAETATQALTVWTKYVGNPVFDVGPAGSWDDVKYISANSGIPEKNFSARGYGEYRPIFPNNNSRNRVRNRRVEIFIDADVVPKTH